VCVCVRACKPTQQIRGRACPALHAPCPLQAYSPKHSLPGYLSTNQAHARFVSLRYFAFKSANYSWKSEIHK